MYSTILYALCGHMIDYEILREFRLNLGFSDTTFRHILRILCVLQKANDVLETYL
jgi:hypothetical protein